MPVGVDVSEWVGFAANIGQLVEELNSIELEVLDKIGSAIAQSVRNDVQRDIFGSRAEPRTATGTYLFSFGHTLEGSVDQAQLILGHVKPLGSEVEKLGVYWKVLEFGGAVPSSPPPRAPFIRWGLAKFGSAAAGLAVRKLVMQRGVLPQPILNKYFVFSGETAVDITQLTKDMISEILPEIITRQFISTLSQRAASAGISVIKGNLGRSQRTGRFVSLRGL